MPGLTSKQVESFWSEGFVAPLPALSPAEARGLRDWVETFERDHPHDRWAFNLKTNLLFESVDRLVRDARFLDPVEDLIGPNLLISTATFRIKEAMSPGYYGWHQDDQFIQMGPCWVLVFLAITDCTFENGCAEDSTTKDSTTSICAIEGYHLHHVRGWTFSTACLSCTFSSSSTASASVARTSARWFQTGVVIHGHPPQYFQRRHPHGG